MQSWDGGGGGADVALVSVLGYFPSIYLYCSIYYCTMSLCMYTVWAEVGQLGYFLGIRARLPGPCLRGLARFFLPAFIACV